MPHLGITIKLCKARFKTFIIWYDTQGIADIKTGYIHNALETLQSNGRALARFRL